MFGLNVCRQVPVGDAQVALLTVCDLRAPALAMANAQVAMSARGDEALACAMEAIMGRLQG